MQKIVTFLWFDDQAEEAMNFYVSIFANSRVVRVSRYGEGAPRPKGTAIVAHFQLEGQDFHALNGGPMFSFTPAISLLVNCETQAEIDDLWARLSAGGEGGRCGWLKDKFGLSWQIVPARLAELMRDPAAGPRVMQALMGMDKLDLAALERAAGQA